MVRTFVKYAVPGLVFLASQAALAAPPKNCAIEEVLYGRNRETKSATGDGGQVGAVAVMVNSVSRDRGGPEIGIAIVRTVNLGLHSLTPGPGALYDSSATIFLADGTFTTVTVSDYDRDAVAKKIERAVVGGTGKYAGARGVVVIEPIAGGGRGEHKATFSGEVFCREP